MLLLEYNIRATNCVFIKEPGEIIAVSPDYYLHGMYFMRQTNTQQDSLPNATAKAVLLLDCTESAAVAEHSHIAPNPRDHHHSVIAVGKSQSYPSLHNRVWDMLREIP